MSVLSQFAGSGIKSIQRGSTQLTGNSDAVTISSVDVTKTIVLATYRNGRALFSSNTDTTFTVSASAVLTNATTLTVYRGNIATGEPVNPTLDWQVVEFF